MITYQLFVEALIQRVTRVRDGKLQKKIVTKAPYKIKDGSDVVLMSALEQNSRKKAAKIAAKHRRDRHADAQRKREHSNNIRNHRNIEDRSNEVDNRSK